MVGRAAEPANRELAPRTAEIDRTGTFPSQGLDALKREGFWKLRVAREHLEAAGRGRAFASSNKMSAVTPDGNGFRVENVRKSYVTSAGRATHRIFR